MSNYNQFENQDIENTDNENQFAGMSNEGRELWRRAISDALELKIREIEEKIKEIEIPAPSDRLKINESQNKAES